MINDITKTITICAALAAVSFAVHRCTSMVDSSYRSYNDAMAGCTSRGASFVPTGGNSYVCVQGRQEQSR